MSPSWIEAPFWFGLQSDSFPSDGELQLLFITQSTDRAFNQAALKGFVCPKLAELVIRNDLSSLNKFSFPVMADNWVSRVTGANPFGSRSRLLGEGHGGAWKALTFPVTRT